MLTRDEFIEYFKNLDSRIDGNDPGSPLWVPEAEYVETCNWFVCVEPIGVHRFKSEYYQWCNSVLAGKVLCFSSDSEGQKEWWGFTCKEDVPIWMLKWM